MTLHDHLTAITAAAASIPQSREDAASHSPEWRHLLQCIRNLQTPTAKASALGGFSAVFEAAKPIEDVEPNSAEKAEVLLRIWAAATDLGMLRDAA